jgi:hypothetical protein
MITRTRRFKGPRHVQPLLTLFKYTQAAQDLWATGCKWENATAVSVLAPQTQQCWVKLDYPTVVCRRLSKLDLLRKLCAVNPLSPRSSLVPDHVSLLRTPTSGVYHDAHLVLIITLWIGLSSSHTPSTLQDVVPACYHRGSCASCQCSSPKTAIIRLVSSCPCQAFDCTQPWCTNTWRLVH